MLGTPEDLLPDHVTGDLCRFVAYWIEAAAGRTMPAFADIDALQIPWALSRVFVVRVVDGGTDFVYRLAGEAISQRYRGGIAGKRVTDLLVPASAAEVLARWRRVVGTPAACFVDSGHPTSSGLAFRGLRAVLPLGPRDGSADHIIGMTVFDLDFKPQSDCDGTVINTANTHAVRWVSLAEPGLTAPHVSPSRP